MIQPKTWLWICVFGLPILAAQILIFLSHPTQLGFLGFPNWLSYCLLIHVVYLVGLYFFTRKAGREQ